MEKSQPEAFEQVLERILNVNRVEGYVIIDEHGLKASERMESSTALQYAHYFSEVASNAKSLIRELDPTNELVYFRVKTKEKEVLAAVAGDEIYMIIQNDKTNVYGGLYGGFRGRFP